MGEKCPVRGARRRQVGEIAIHLISHEARDHISVLQPGARVHPVRAVRHHVADVIAEIDLTREVNTREQLPGAVHQWVAPLHRGRRPLHRIGGRVLVADHDSIGHAGGGGLIAHLPVQLIGGHESEVHTPVSSSLDCVEHLLGPVLIMSAGDEAPAAQQGLRIGVGIDVGRIGHVVTGLLQPMHKLDVPRQEEPHPLPREWPIKRHSYGLRPA